MTHPGFSFFFLFIYLFFANLRPCGSESEQDFATTFRTTVKISSLRDTDKWVMEAQSSYFSKVQHNAGNILFFKF